MKKLYALRGAVQCMNTESDICDQVSKMYDELLALNNLDEDGIVSIIFSVTEDIDAINPCAALRKTGRAGEAALFAVREAESKNSLPSVIRVMIHCYLEEGCKVKHVYRNGAEILRPDRKA